MEKRCTPLYTWDGRWKLWPLTFGAYRFGLARSLLHCLHHWCSVHARSATLRSGCWYRFWCAFRNGGGGSTGEVFHLNIHGSRRPSRLGLCGGVLTCDWLAHLLVMFTDWEKWGSMNPMWTGFGRGRACGQDSVGWHVAFACGIHPGSNRASGRSMNRLTP